MRIEANVQWAVLVLLVSVRVGVVMYAFSALSSVRMPGQFRILLVIALSAALVGALNPALRMDVVSVGSLVTAFAQEAVLAGVMALMLSILFAAMHFGGQLLDTQIGFGLANLIDPITRSQSPLLGVVLNLAAVVVFLALDGHHWIVRGLAASLEQIPPGAGLNLAADLSDASAIISAPLAMIFVHGLAVVAPAVMGVLLVDIGFAVLSRSVPQMNVLVVSIPAKILVGLGLFTLSLAYMTPLVQQVTGEFLGFWSALR